MLNANSVAAHEAKVQANVDLVKAEEDLASLKAQNKSSSQQRTKCADLAEHLTKAMVEKINRILYSDTPVELTDGLEPFVAILRNKMDATNVDVEIFFSKHENLQAKMKRLEMRDMNLDVIKAKMPLINDIIKAKTWDNTHSEEGDKNWSDLIDILSWAKFFCEGALIELELKAAEDAVEDLKNQATASSIEYNKAQRIVDEIGQ